MFSLQMMFGLASVIMVIFTCDSVESKQTPTQILSSLRDKQALLRFNTENDEFVSRMLQGWEFLRQYLVRHCFSLFDFEAAQTIIILAFDFALYAVNHHPHSPAA